MITTRLEAATIPSVLEVFLQLYKADANVVQIRNRFLSSFSHPEVELATYLDYLLETGASAGLSFVRQVADADKAAEVIRQVQAPVLLFVEWQGRVQPVVAQPGQPLRFYFPHQPEAAAPVSPEEVLARLVPVSTESRSRQVLLVACFPNPAARPEAAPGGSVPKKQTPFSRFLTLLASEKREIGYLYVYAAFAGLITLALPLGIQSIISYISSGQIATSVVVLISLMVLAILLTGGLQIMQLWLVEYIQQRLFARTAFDFAFRVPRLRFESLLQYNPPELMNRFFDTVTLQKGLAGMLIDFSAALLQILFGLILLSFYHPYFIFFGLFLMLVLMGIIRLTGPRGIKTSLYESKFKYQLAGWLEEIARALSTFKLAGYSNLPLDRTDQVVTNYLLARQQHFRVLITQYISFVGFKTLVTGGLLILGCLLVINQELNIGQFVASEIVIILIMNAVEKVIVKLDTVYDVLTSLEKIGTVTDMPIESAEGIRLDQVAASQGLALDVKNLSYRYPGSSRPVLQEISFGAASGERLCLAGYENAGRKTLVHVLLGLLDSYQGHVSYNGISLRELNLNSIMSQIGDTTSEEQLFEGTLLDNITTGRTHLRLQEVLWATQQVGLEEYVQQLPEGLHTMLIGGTRNLSRSVARKILLARSLVQKPRLLLLDDPMLGDEQRERQRLLQLLLQGNPGWTILILSNDPQVMQRCDRVLVMQNGRLTAQGTFEQLRHHPELQPLLPQSLEV